MKKLFSISLFAALAVAPLMASADDVWRASQAEHTALGTKAAAGAYVKGAYNGNVGNINTGLTYVEDSTVATINAATVSASGAAVTVNVTPTGSVSVNGGTLSGTVTVPNTVDVYDTWGSANTTTSGLNTTSANVSGTVSGVTATFTGTPTGNLSGTGSFSGGTVSVDGWHADTSGITQ